MTDSTADGLVPFLTTASLTTLGDLQLSRLNLAALHERDLLNLLAGCAKKRLLPKVARELRDTIRAFVSNLAEAEAAQILRNFRTQREIELAPSPNKTIPPNGWFWIGDREDLDGYEVAIFRSIKRICIQNAWRTKVENVADTRISELMRDSHFPKITVRRVLQSLAKKRFIEAHQTQHGLRIVILEPPLPLYSSTLRRDLRKLPGSTLESLRKLPGSTLEPLRMLPGSTLEPSGPLCVKERDLKSSSGTVLTDDDKLKSFLLAHFKNDSRFPALHESHIEMAIPTIRGRASSPPGSKNFWIKSVELFLLDFEHELRAEEKRDAVAREARVGSGPVAAYPVTRKVAQK